MNSFKNTSLSFALLLTLAGVASGCGGHAASPAQAAVGASSPSTDPAPAQTQSSEVTVSSPASGATVGSPFKLTAKASQCSSQSVISIGYSLDNSTNTTAVSGTSINTQVPAPSGTHTLYVKYWGAGGASCYTTVTVSVTGSAAPESMIPSDAKQNVNMQNAPGWQASHDPAAGEASSGSMNVVSSPSMSGHARQFATSFSHDGGEIYNLAFDNDPNAMNFFYDGWVYVDNSAGNIQNLELDTNQVLSNGNTVIYGFQCDGISGTWDYTANHGTASHPVDTWVHSNQFCNVRTWGRNTWHHVQISYSRDNSGNVTYHSVWLDGKEQQIEATVSSEFALGWTPALLTNFQVDGLGSGSNKIFLDKLTISRW
ncbi:MAG: hypothetical protein ACLGPM_04970 [Acidobacteriota bacterium]